MKRAVRRSGKKNQKSNFEERFASMVSEYHKAKEILDSMVEGTAEYVKQKKICDNLFASAERFVNANS
ncbi:hypothetical protein [Celerinatantimonas diazotrophica]|jgi:hypothetical protein|nr:hypothetical protein [Celerinatantimonas diazotrophica]